MDRDKIKAHVKNAQDAWKRADDMLGTHDQEKIDWDYVQKQLTVAAQQAHQGIEHIIGINMPAAEQKLEPKKPDAPAPAPAPAAPGKKPHGLDRPAHPPQ